MYVCMYVGMGNLKGEGILPAVIHSQQCFFSHTVTLKFGNCSLLHSSPQLKCT